MKDLIEGEENNSKNDEERFINMKFWIFDECDENVT